MINYEIIAKALFENYETIYDINLETNAYTSFHESEEYKKLKLEKSGEDFFALLPKKVEEVIAPEDREYVLGMLNKNRLIKGVTEDKYYSFVYRIIHKDKEVYHQIRATLQPEEDGKHVFMGIRKVDAMMRRDISHREKIQAMRQRERNHLEAILSSAAAYMEANLSKDELIEKSDDKIEIERRFIKSLPSLSEIPGYEQMHEWICENLITENVEKYREVGSRENLLNCFEKGELRTSVYFSVYTKEAGTQPCREVFFLYKEKATGDIHVFCVIYNLTEQQKKEMEKEMLEKELSRSRLRNFTSQMQPHFLYNALGSIQEVILMNPEHASELLGDFTVHLRSCIKSMTNDDPITFSQELENIRAYANIEKMRFGNKLDMRYELGPTRFAILPLTIQPIVENAIRHGIYGRGTEGGKVIIRTRDVKDAWLIEIEDDGVGFDYSAYKERQKKGREDSTGLENIIFRLETIMNAGLTIESRVGEGTKVSVEIPKEREKDESDNC